MQRILTALTLVFLSTTILAGEPSAFEKWQAERKPPPAVSEFERWQKERTADSRKAVFLPTTSDTSSLLTEPEYYSRQWWENDARRRASQVYIRPTPRAVWVWSYRTR